MVEQVEATEARVSDYSQKMPQSHAADKLVASQVREAEYWLSHGIKRQVK